MEDRPQDQNRTSPVNIRWKQIVQSRVWPEIHAWFVPELRKRYRAWLFQGYIAMSLAAFTGLAIMARIFAYFHFDLEITLELQRVIPPWFGAILYWVSWPGYLFGSSIILVSVVLLLLQVGLRWEGLIAFLAATTSTLMNTIIKVAIRRPRPSQSLVEVVQQLNSYSFPSGHVMFYSSFFGFMAFLSFTLIKRTWLRTVLTAFFSLLVLLVGVSRIYLGEHWASDVIGGYILGFLILTAAIHLYRWGQQRKFSMAVSENAPQP